MTSTAYYVGDPGDRVARITATAGQVMLLAGRTPHTVRNETERDAVAFVVHAPGPPMEQFCRTTADLAMRGDVDMATVLRLAEQHGIEILDRFRFQPCRGLPHRLSQRSATGDQVARSSGSASRI